MFFLEIILFSYFQNTIFGSELQIIYKPLYTSMLDLKYWKLILIITHEDSLAHILKHVIKTNKAHFELNLEIFY